MLLETIRSLLNEDLILTDQCIVSRLESDIPLIREVIEYVMTCGGKRIRPMILLLSAQALSYQGKQHIELAAVIELIHTATLLHDDVVDHSTLRRGHKTAHTIWGSNASVLIGDFLYSRAFQIVVDFKHQTILDIFAHATHYIAEGELMQLVNCNNPNTTENHYFEIIQRKTAKLFEIATHLAAIIAHSSDHEVIAMSNYGLHLGLAYQLIDDALDYNQSPEQTGKNVGQDLSEGKTTLPLIHAMRKSRGADLHLIQEAIKTGSSENLETILGIIESTEAIKYTADTAKYHAEKAKQAISQLTASSYRKALEEMTHFVVERTY